MEILMYSTALLVGLLLGFVGGGGSILAVPIFVYIFGIDPVLATAYSLFVVGATSVVGTMRYYKLNLVDIKTGIIFGIPAIISVFITRKFLIPAIPNHLFSLGTFEMTKATAIMIFFGIIMLLASYSMFKGKNEETNKGGPIQYNYPMILLEGLVVGLVTGLVGAGGGFLIIPALVVLAKVPMKRAVGTSLMIISLKSLIGFLGDVSNMKIDWEFLLIFTSLSIIGIFIGSYLTKKVDNQWLKKAFGWFVLAMAIFITLQSIFGQQFGH